MRVLSIDGGGVRGLLPATLIAELEARAGKPAHELFDLMVGTSIGGIMVLALTVPDREDPRRPRFSGRKLIDFYAETAPQIFAASVPRKLLTGDSLLHEKYSDEALQEILADGFGDVLLSAALSPVMVTAYDTERRRPMMFKSEKAKVDPERNHRMRLVARAAIAAPTFFEPVRLETATGERTVVDGGIYANNPAMCAYAEAMKTGAGDDLFMVSIGTGSPALAFRYDEIRDWGLVHWARPLLDFAISGVNHAVNHQLEHLLAPHCYYRLQAHIGHQHLRVDDVGSLTRTRDAAAKLIAERDGDLDAICERLLQGTAALDAS
jgi:uncharacterized protein